MSYPFCRCLLLRPGPSLKLGSVVVVVVFFLVGVANRHSWDSDWFAGCVPITCIWRAGKTQYFYSARSSKYEVPRSEMCVSGLYHLFSVPLILLTNVYNGFGRPTLDFVDRFWLWLGSVGSVSKITQMNWKELISQLQMHSQVNSQVTNVLKCTQKMRSRSLATWSHNLKEAWDAEVKTWSQYHCVSRRATT